MQRSTAAKVLNVCDLQRLKQARREQAANDAWTGAYHQRTGDKYEIPSSNDDTSQSGEESDKNCIPDSELDERPTPQKRRGREGNSARIGRGGSIKKPKERVAPGGWSTRTRAASRKRQQESLDEDQPEISTESGRNLRKRSETRPKYRG